jgi:hypothetical protein
MPLFDGKNAPGPSTIERATTIDRLFEAGQRLMRIRASYSNLAIAMAPILKAKLKPEDLEELGWDERGNSLENGTRAIEALAAGETPHVYVVFDGETPKTERRPFVLGNAATGQFRLVAFVLASRPLKAQDELTIAMPDGAAINGRWTTSKIPGAVFQIPGLTPPAPGAAAEPA